MKTIAVINQKGGVGKTACAYNLAFRIAIKKNQTCLIDLDPSANASKGLLPEYSLKDAYTVKDFLLTNALEQCLHNVEFDNEVYQHLKIIPSKIDLALAQRDLINKPYRETFLQKKLQVLNSAKSQVYFDYYIIDCSPTLSDLTINAIYAADFILIPVTYEDDALEGLADLFQVIKEIKEERPFQFKIVRNQKDMRKTKTNEYIENKLSDFLVRGHILNTIIRQDENINQAKIERRPIFLYSPYSNGADDFTALTEEILLCLN